MTEYLMAKKDSNKMQFTDMDEAIKYFKEIYPVLPEEVLQNTIEYCLKHPKKMPPNHEEIDITKPAKNRKPTVIEVEDKVKIWEPNDPNIPEIKHRDAASLLNKEEAEILQEKINKALEEQKRKEEKDVEKSKQKLLKDALRKTPKSKK